MDTVTASIDFRSETAPLYAFISSRVGHDQAVAEDVTQETLLAAIQGRWTPERGPARAWLIGIALRKIVDHQRKGHIARGHVAALSRELAVRMVREPLPVEWIEREGVRAGVNEALARLTNTQAALLVRKYLDGASVADIAGELSVSEKAAESALTRARLALHEEIQRLAGPDLEFTA
jgi:RNA polymerase sigma-70 factor (ECF subfamily)